MICPTCGNDNLPGSEECSYCQQDLTQLDRPVPNNRVERSLMEDHVRLLNPRRTLTVGPDASVQEALDAMLGPGIGALVVVGDGDKMVGIFTERDLLTKVAGLPEPLSALKVRDFMTPSPESVRSDDSLAFALHKMD